MGIDAWRQHPPRAPVRQRVASWRARQWRRVVLAWFATALVIMAVGAEPAVDFPRAQASSVPVIRVVLRAAAALAVVGGPVLLIMLP